MKVEMEWRGGIHLRAKTEEGHLVDFDGAPVFGGTNAGVRPMQMVLAALAACMGIDVLSMLRKSKVDLSECKITVRGDRVDETPKVFKHIHLHYHLVGEKLSAATVDRCLSLSAEKYCSVAAMLEPNVEISYDHNIK